MSVEGASVFAIQSLLPFLVGYHRRLWVSEPQYYQNYKTPTLVQSTVNRGYLVLNVLDTLPRRDTISN